MRIEDLQVVLRPRRGWEAAELGLALVRRHGAVIWPAWLAMVLPLAVLLHLLLWRSGQLWLAGLLLWWLKPVFERSVLYVISRAVFGQSVSVGQALRAQWHFGRARLPAHLLWRRLSPARSLLMPVDMLEGGSARLCRQRRRTLLGSEFGMAALVTWLMMHFEAVLVVGLLALGALMVPPDMLGDSARALWETLRAGHGKGPALVFNTLWLLAMSAIGPLYVGAGFGLYLDARTRREAWDVELGLRRLGQRLGKARSGPGSLLLACLLGAAALLPAAGPARAATPAAPAQAPADATVQARTPGFAQAVDAAYRHPDLGTQRSMQRWRLGDEKDRQQRNNSDSDDSALARLLKPVLELLAGLMSGVLWLLVGLLVLALLLTARRWLPWLRGRGRKPVPAPISQVSLPLPEALPADVAGHAADLWAQGRGRQAMALLYRASVQAMARLSGQPLPAGATEAYCLRAARALPGADQRQLFASVVAAWQHTAYAGRLPEPARFAALLQQLRQQPGWLQ